jgi:hypothetical protein
MSLKGETISRGTLEVEDLLFAFSRYIQTRGVAAIPEDAVCALEGQLRSTVFGTRRTRSARRQKLLVSRVIPLMSLTAPKGYFFGLHPGDPGRIGVWSDRLRFVPRH